MTVFHLSLESGVLRVAIAIFLANSRLTLLCAKAGAGIWKLETRNWKCLDVKAGAVFPCFGESQMYLHQFSVREFCAGCSHKIYHYYVDAAF